MTERDLNNCEKINTKYNQIKKAAAKGDDVWEMLFSQINVLKQPYISIIDFCAYLKIILEKYYNFEHEKSAPIIIETINDGTIADFDGVAFHFNKRVFKDIVKPSQMFVAVNHLAHEFSHCYDIKVTQSERKQLYTSDDKPAVNFDSLEAEIIGSIVKDRKFEKALYFCSDNEKRARDNALEFTDFFIDKLKNYSQSHLGDYLETLSNSLAAQNEECKQKEFADFEALTNYKKLKMDDYKEIVEDWQNYHTENLKIKDNLDYIIDGYIDKFVRIAKTVNFTGNEKLLYELKDSLKENLKYLDINNYLLCLTTLYDCNYFSVSENNLRGALKNYYKANRRLVFENIFNVFSFIDLKQLIGAIIDIYGLDEVKTALNTKDNSTLSLNQLKLIDEQIYKVSIKRPETASAM